MPCTFAEKITAMKKLLLLPFLALIFLSTGCDNDPYPLEVERFDVFWFDGDNSGTRTPNDELDFDVRINTTDPDADDQFITEWELSYTANGQFVGVLQSDQGLITNSLNFEGTIAIKNLPLPWAGGLLPGDKIEFRFWAADNHGTAFEQFYLFTLE